MKTIKPAYWVVIQNSTHYRLCKDGKLRQFANFGTFPECVNTYKHEGHAINAAEKHLKDDWELRGIHVGEHMDAAGNVFNEEGNCLLHRCLYPMGISTDFSPEKQQEQKVLKFNGE